MTEIVSLGAEKIEMGSHLRGQDSSPFALRVNGLDGSINLSAGLPTLRYRSGATLLVSTVPEVFEIQLCADPPAGEVPLLAPAR